MAAYRLVGKSWAFINNLSLVLRSLDRSERALAYAVARGALPAGAAGNDGIGAA